MKVSYIISSIGNSDKLEALINNIVEHLNDNEIILIDNSFEKKLEQYSLNKNIKYYHEKSSGISYARNRGAFEAKNQLLVFMDDDIIPQSNFYQEINTISKMKHKDFIVGGKIIPNNIPKCLPEKYGYLVGKKDFGNKIKRLKKYNYLGGCLLIMPKTTYNYLNGFSTDYGHKGNIFDANEDVIIQDFAYKKKIDVIYNPNLIVVHYWKGNIDVLFNRIKTQGISDRKVDLKYHKLRFVLKYIKFTLYIFFLHKSNDETVKFDIMRYKSYVYNKTNI